MADPGVGKYLNDHFVSSYQKVGTFRIINGKKQGGNVASYFCLPDGRVLHVVAGPANAATLLREARWTVETWKLAQLEGRDNPARFGQVIRRAHYERLQREHGISNPMQLQLGRAITKKGLVSLVERSGLGLQGQVHCLLGRWPLPQVDEVYGVVWTTILKEELSNSPVLDGDVPFVPADSPNRASNLLAARLEPARSPICFIAPSSDPDLRRLAKEGDFAAWLARKRQLGQ